MIEVNNILHGRMVAREAGARFCTESDQVISRVKSGRLLGGVVYQNYTRRTIEAHIAGFEPGWMNKSYLWIIFDYPFNQLGCQSIFLQIKESNPSALAFATKLGFNIEFYVPDVYPEGGMNLLRMRREACRFLDLDCRAKRLMNRG